MKKLKIVPLSPVEIYNAGKANGPTSETEACRTLEALKKVQEEPLLVDALEREENGTYGNKHN